MTQRRHNWLCTVGGTTEIASNQVSEDLGSGPNSTKSSISSSVKWAQTHEAITKLGPGQARRRPWPMAKHTCAQGQGASYWAALATAPGESRGASPIRKPWCVKGQSPRFQRGRLTCVDVAMGCFRSSLSPAQGASSVVWVFPELASIQGTDWSFAKINMAQSGRFPEWLWVNQ